ncbi:Glycosyltransferase, group 1 [Sulfitobacter noctilucae]|uniref:glycosyltransferase family 4 protein n=1 Tax=Sulfitobacter noctilucae TaxID=1342302 RepID=UPI000A4B50E8|nr:Glycosyltransferase, group 1 [Sulfitobacter noctilucae]
MLLAFYAPMKPPDDPVPSGDRTIARNLLKAFEAFGAEMTLASRFRSRDGQGDPFVQRKTLDAAEAEVERLIAMECAADWEAWVTYHSYYKAPDLLGPKVSRALNIPYIQIEATRARKRLNGPWALFAQAAEAATDAARVVYYFTQRDAESLETHAPSGQHLLHLKPFLPRTELGPRSTLGGPMLSVGMMRKGDKLASYTLIAETLAALEHDDWALEIAGDGPARVEVAALMAPFKDRIRFLGQLHPDTMQDVYAQAKLLFWPGVNEALGMVYLEAQAAGLPIVAQDRPGMNELLGGGPHPAPGTGASGLAQRLSVLLSDQTALKDEGDTVRHRIETGHLMPAASTTLRNGLRLAGVAS